MSRSGLNRKRFVTFYDILGFGDLVKNKNIDSVTNLYRELIETNISNLQDKEFKNEKLNLKTLHYFIISDSILIYTDDDTYPSFRKLVYISLQLFSMALYKGFPLRGVITRGEVSFINARNNDRSVNVNVILGEPIVRAYRLEKEYEWAGCVIDPGCVEELDKFMDGSCPLLTGHAVVHYMAPKKSGEVKSVPVLNWARKELPGGSAEAALEKIFKMHGKRTNDWSVKTKIDNTASFYRWCRQQQQNFHSKKRAT
jgi:hypothetical protein